MTSEQQRGCIMHSGSSRFLTWWPHQQHSLGGPSTRGPELLRLAEEVDHLHQLNLRQRQQQMRQQHRPTLVANVYIIWRARKVAAGRQGGRRTRPPPDQSEQECARMCQHGKRLPGLLLTST
eukprot:GHRQ01034315.1.p1 GENE.GHRQ01034315.1~~GHRQ01034315.1.p1  ORF type:complete len:122 (-),score=9.36 GHRQ01034315.1:220-585(-)